MEGLQKLLQFNKWAALAHFFAFLGFLYIYIFHLKRDFIYSDIYRLGATEPPAGEPVDALSYTILLKKVFSLNIPLLILFFFFSTIIFHLIYAYDFQGLYSKYVKEGWNPIRWTEYAISASVMIAIIGALSGIRDITSLTALTIAMGTLQYCGLLIEHESLKIVPDLFVVKITTFIAWALFSAVWIPIIYSFYTVLKDAKSYNAKIPNWVWIVIFFQLFNFAAFGLVQMKQVRAMLKRMPVPDFKTIERMYIKRSFTSKLVLGAGIGYGLLSRQNSQ